MGFVNKEYFGEKELTPTQKVLQFFWDLLKVVCVSLAIIIPVRYFLIQPFYVKGASMEPSFYDHEYLIIDEISYRFNDPSRGDIIVFKYPKDPSQYFIKRIIGLPGEVVDISDNRVYIHGADDNKQKFLLEENEYLPDENRTLDSRKWTLGPDEYYVMGDNREYSLDSRRFGPVDSSLIIGRVWFRGWPFWRFTTFPEVQYQ
ncbi:signal peptidase I [Candidatus Falkowbacteria bacterium]|jgi:signal peptidase I|nr:signal peptidase I [Candidatus Falkowbacteria bacterium]MBT6574484.1 signal peptidase I [Candidatus Falkowbacteria bacterium]MBT7348108.1 signal peptidase I [Candidatus Falkowbacteria bacterium]MBT7500751.1 signal peptidase I [Candidatus Falkowbacteria bacterium]